MLRTLFQLLAMTLLALISGAVWGKPTWGTWWVWDARITSMLILLFLYLGVVALYEAYDNKEAAGKAGLPWIGPSQDEFVQLFKDALPLTGIVLTKLDGTAKGGVILGIVDAHGVPIEFIGVGERVEDLKAFDTETFVEALFETPEATDTPAEAISAS